MGWLTMVRANWVSHLWAWSSGLPTWIEPNGLVDSGPILWPFVEFETHDALKLQPYQNLFFKMPLIRKSFIISCQCCSTFHLRLYYSFWQCLSFQVRLIGYCTQNSLFLVYEFIENGNLSQHLRGSGTWNCMHSPEPYTNWSSCWCIWCNVMIKFLLSQGGSHCRGLLECRLPLIQQGALSISMSILFQCISIVISNQQTFW